MNKRDAVFRALLQHICVLCTVCMTVMTIHITPIFAEDENYYDTCGYDAANVCSINSQSELEALQTYVASGGITASRYYRLETDISLNKRWTPIGNETHPFSGNINGNAKTIYGLAISTRYPEETHAGLFGYLSNATISSLTIFTNSTGVDGTNYVGILAGQAVNSTIEGVHVSGSVTGSNDVGGLVGSMSGSIMTSVSTAIVQGTINVGGLVGYSSATISESFASARVNGTTNVGGLVGNNNNQISDSYSTGSVSGTTATGGFVGNNQSSINKSYSTSDVAIQTNMESIGLFIGRSSGSIFGGYVYQRPGFETAGIEGLTELTLAQMLASNALGINGTMAYLGGQAWEKTTSTDQTHHTPELIRMQTSSDERVKQISSDSTRVDRKPITLNEDTLENLTLGTTATELINRIEVKDADTNSVILGSLEIIASEPELNDNSEFHESSHTVSLRFTPDDILYEVRTFQATLNFLKKTGAAISDITATTLGSDSIRINAELETQTGQRILYGVIINGEIQWSSSNIITELEPETTYEVYVKSEENDLYFEGAIISGGTVRTASTHLPIITIGSDNWSRFLTTTTYDTMYKTPIIVEFEVNESATEQKAFNYLMVDAFYMDEASLRDSEHWKTNMQRQPLSPGQNTYTLNITQPFKGVIYMETTDEFGFLKMSRTPGILIVAESNPFLQADFNRERDDDLELTVEMRQNTVKAIQYKGETLGEDVVSYGVDTITFTQAYLESLPNGTHDFIVSYYPLGYEEPLPEGTIGVNDTLISINIQGKNNTVLEVPSGIQTVTYGDQGVHFPVNSNRPGEIHYTISDPSVLSIDAHTGVITLHKASENVIDITVTQEETQDYTQASATIQVKVEPKSISLTINDQEKYYMGSEPEYTYEINGLVNGDTLAVDFNENTELPGQYEISYTIDLEDKYVIDTQSIGMITIKDNPPTGSITINENLWDTLVKTITFGLFGKDTLSVNFSADDIEAPDSLHLSYLLSENSLSEEDLEYNPDMIQIVNGYTLTLDANFVGFVYLKITDSNQNITLIGSDGLVVFKDSEPEIEQEFSKAQSSDLRVEIEMNGNVVKAIERHTQEGNILGSNDAVEVIQNALIFKNAYLKTLPQGIHTFEISYHPLGVLDSMDQSGIGTTTLTIQVFDISSNPTLYGGMLNVQYGDQPLDLNEGLEGVLGSSPITWTSSHPELVSVDADSGMATFHHATHDTRVMISATQRSDGLYEDAIATAVVTVSPMDVVVQANHVTRHLGEAMPDFTYTISPSIQDDLGGTLISQGEGVGEYDIVEEIPFEHRDYTITFIKGTLSVVNSEAMDQIIAQINTQLSDEAYAEVVILATQTFNTLSAQEQAPLLEALQRAQEQVRELYHTTDHAIIDNVAWNVRLISTPVTPTDVTFEPTETQLDQYSLIRMLDLKLVDILTMQDYQIPSGDRVRATLVDINQPDGVEVLIVHQKNDGTFETFRSVVQNNALEFEIDSFSLFGFYVLSTPTPPDVQPTPPDVQPTPPDVQPTPPDVQPTPPDVQPTPPDVQPTPPDVQPTPPVEQETVDGEDRISNQTETDQQEIVNVGSVSYTLQPTRLIVGGMLVLLGVYYLRRKEMK
ncbi:hypothetical protein AOC36_09080 [Erysipelothrix larvae]|uniref:MBG domain-containing protein n=1 Tax=Erysipelothrix larvae TaxID=1514105 RepID=A0A0X8H131_9FIRM|nr:MBG domain-containing protein [Erysipelothrix larvae]AMC94135.1 hypothetical protein AOC36_09080 [Erysipelothrix larvae]